MEVVHERCCGLDIHKKAVVACLMITGPKGEVKKEIRSFGTMTEDLLGMADWLGGACCTHVAMESTGVYWKPIYNLLEERFTLLLVNAQHIKAVPGRKTDVKDSEWIADLLRHGLLRASFVPDREQRELRELIRFRGAMVREHTAGVNRLAKLLEGANIKLSSVVSDVNGRAARAMVEELVAGSADVVAMAELAKGRMREKIPELQKALKGEFDSHQRFVVAEQLAHLDYLEGTIERVGAEIAERMRPFEQAVEQLDTIPGVGPETAQTIIAEIGGDTSRFPTERHLSSWAGVCPGNNESAGKRRSGKTRKGNKLLRTILVQAANAAGRSKGNYLSARYHRLASRMGKKKAALAVAHKILVIAYQLLNRHEPYRDLGANYYDERNKEVISRKLVKRLKDLGYQVAVQPTPSAA
jgi:transposase